MRRSRIARKPEAVAVQCKVTTRAHLGPWKMTVKNLFPCLARIGSALRASVHCLRQCLYRIPVLEILPMGLTHHVQWRRWTLGGVWRGWHVHVTCFTRHSPTLVLQVTNAGVRRPGNEARIWTKEPLVKWKVMSHRWTCWLAVVNVRHLFSIHNGSNSLVQRIALPFAYLRIP